MLYLGHTYATISFIVDLTFKFNQELSVFSGNQIWGRTAPDLEAPIPLIVPSLSSLLDAVTCRGGI